MSIELHVCSKDFPIKIGQFCHILLYYSAPHPYIGSADGTVNHHHTSVYIALTATKLQMHHAHQVCDT